VVAVKDAAKKARLQALYAKRWRDYVAHYTKLVAGQPPEAAAATQRTLASGDHLAAHFHQAPVLLVFCFDPTKMAITDAALPRVSVVGGASIYTAVENALLACRAEGLGCTLTTLLCQDEPEVCALLEIPPPWATACVVPIGWPLRGRHGPLRRRPVEKLAFVDAFGRAFPG
jgi:nitroreductase